MARAYSVRHEAHRDLKLDKDRDYQKGRDVAALQAAGERRLDARGMGRYAVAVDGVYGPATALMARKAIWALGAPLANVENVRTEHDPEHPQLEGVLPVWAQDLIRHPGRRTEEQLGRARDRRDELNPEPSRSGLVVVARDVHGVYRTGGYGEHTVVEWDVHHAAGPRPATMGEAIALIRSYDRSHAAKWRGGIGYHEIYDADGRIYAVRAPGAIGAHVALKNTGRYGVCFLDNFESRRPTAAQLRTLRARATEAPPAGLPDLRRLRGPYGHREVPGQSTACPGRYMLPHVQALR